ncbi:DUF4190 domain-containing protein [Botrimarina mediterranea]|uniref:DUF4190 domain-containing protein n=1 Tax=Botrimarina mediterranea TaxID=2528022 RepID=UPI0011877844|nr:hypothetical protein K2D_12240 [Planctomycetes bacterium K2D]
MSEGVKHCPICGEEILAVAKKCRHCRSYLDPSLRAAAEAPSAMERLALPVGRPATAIVAGYAALFAILPLFGLPFAITAATCGVFALRKINRTPGLSGRGRAWFGIIIGSLMTIVSLLALVVVIIDATSRGGR